MKLIELRCPNCDAPLAVDRARSEAICKHCGATFLIEGAPKGEPQESPNVVKGPANRRTNHEESSSGLLTGFVKAETEIPKVECFAEADVASHGAKPNVRSIIWRSKLNKLRKAGDEEEPIHSDTQSIVKTGKRPTVLVLAVAAFFLVLVVVLAGTCSKLESHKSTTSDLSAHSGQTTSGNSSDAGFVTTSAASPIEKSAGESLSETQSSSRSASTAAAKPSAIHDGFSCNLDGYAFFSGVTIPVDSVWKDVSPAWDWRRNVFSYTSGGSKLPDVKISVATFTGGDTENAISFLEKYADAAPIGLYSGNFAITSSDLRDGVSYTRVEGIDSNYESAFLINPSSKHETIRKMYEDKVVRCICLVGYANNGTGFVAAVTLRGSANNDASLYSANKILDKVTFTPEECDIDSTDKWLYEVQHMSSH